MLHTSQIKRTLYGLLSLQVPHKGAEDKGEHASRKPSEALSWVESEGRSGTTHASCGKHTWARSLFFMVRVSADTHPQNRQLLQEALLAESLTEQKWTMLWISWFQRY